MRLERYRSLVILLIMASSFMGCGGGGSSGGMLGAGGGGTSATVTGTVTGTTVIAVDETGAVAASCVATGTPPAFSLTFPTGHSYRFYFITNEGTSTQAVYPFFDGTTNVFEFKIARYYDFGAVTMNTTTGTATGSKSILSQGGLVSGGSDNTTPAPVSSKIHTGRDWRFFPSDGEVLYYDGVTSGGSFENRLSNGGTETLTTSDGSIQTTKIVNNMIWSGGQPWHTETDWMAYVSDKVIGYRNLDNGTVVNHRMVFLDFPLYQGKTWTTAYAGEALTATVDNTDMTLDLPIGTLVGVVKISFRSGGTVVINQYHHRDYPLYVKFDNPSGESEVLRQVATGIDTTPPFLAEAVPANSATGVPTNLQTIYFRFTEPMGPGAPVTWTGIDNSYVSTLGWSPDNTWTGFSLTKSLPADTTIGWTLHGGSGPGYFCDLAGNPLWTTGGTFRTAAGPDSAPPALVSASPAEGATGVPTTVSSITFTFSEPMGPAHSVYWVGLDDSYNWTPVWSSDRRSVTFPFTRSLPAGVTVSWTLNDPVHGGGMADLAGNPLPTTSGSFSTAGFAQSDLTGTWDMLQFQTSTQTPGGGWFRGVARFDGNGHLIVDDNTTWQTSGNDPAPANGDAGTILTVGSTGAITASGFPEDPTFHGNMASNRQLIVGTVTLSPNDRAMRIFRKRVPGITYGNADLFGKSFMFNILSAGGAPKWERGNGSIDSTGSVSLANSYDSSGGHSTNLAGVARYSVTAEGIVTDSLDADFRGFITPDKAMVIGTGTNPIGSGLTNFDLMVLTISGQSFAQSDFAGYWNYFQINCGSGTEWGYATVDADVAGNVTLTPLASSGTEPLTPSTGVIALSSSGVTTQQGSSAFQGVMSSGKDVVVVTDTAEANTVFILDILLR